MDQEARLMELLVEWEQREDARESVRLEELCANQPELLEPLRRRVRVLRAMRGVLDDAAFQETDAPDATIGPASSPPGYQIVQVIGRGGMGVVYKAWQESLDRVVALKMILGAEHADAKALARFEAEAKLVARLQHPNIVQVFEIGTHQGRPFIALEYLAGGNLATVLEDYTLTPPEAARLVEVLARAVHYAHIKGVVHRDLKPGNILFTQAGPGPAGRPLLGDPKVVDFGLARQLDRDKRLTATGAVLGTPCYMAPEQASGRTELLGPAVDIYSLGVILYEMLTRRLPFEGHTEWEVIQAVIGKDAPSPRGVNPEVPEALEAVCLRCLHKDPKQRYATAEELAEDLRRFLAGDSPRTATRKAYSTIRRARRRPRWLIAAGAALLGAAGLWALLTLWAARQPAYKLGVLIPLRGEMAANGQAFIDAVRLAADEVNANRGLLGRPIQIVEAERFNDDDAAQATEALITRGACSLIGCWSSVGRKAVEPVLERHRQLLISPAEYEGLEESPNVVYLGTVPNQIILPAMDWFYREQASRKFFLVGQDEIFDHAINAIVGDYLKQWPDARIVGEEYVNVDEGMGKIMEAIRAANPDVIVNTISGDLNTVFFSAIRAPRSALRTTPVLSVDCTERDLMALQPRQLPGCYLVGSYFECLDTPANHTFLNKFKGRYGTHRVAFDVMEAAYAGVHLWARAVRAVGCDDATTVRAALLRQTYQAPEGPIRFDPKTGHAIRFARLARYDDSGKLSIVWSSRVPIDPVPYPTTRTPEQWQEFLGGLYQGWGKRWSK